MRSYLLGGLLALALFSIGACEKTDDLATDDNTNTGTLDPNNVNQKKLLTLVNRYRAQGCTCGNDVMPSVDPISWNPTLADVAQTHSTDMRNHSTMSHTGSDGSTAGQRLTRGGYSWSSYGENIASGYSTEDAVIRAWVQSTGHCKNIMSANKKEMGVARDGNYWTQVFATAR